MLYRTNSIMWCGHSAAICDCAGSRETPRRGTRPPLADYDAGSHSTLKYGLKDSIALQRANIMKWRGRGANNL
jgi:hypothetical protein